jgi:hypothetical protein
MISVIHEYAGFRYFMEYENGLAVRATPCPGQHPAANKEKHRRAALETYQQENRR